MLVSANSQVLSAVIFEFWSSGEFGIADAAGVLYVVILSTALLVAIFAFKANPTALIAPEGQNVEVASDSPEKFPHSG
jgi:ABC-type Fe3+ transport system permease subunit